MKSYIGSLLLTHFQDEDKKLSRLYNKKIHIYFCTGILKNVPTEAVLRPQRGTDVMIVIDANGYDDDNGFDYQVSE